MTLGLGDDDFLSLYSRVEDCIVADGGGDVVVALLLNVVLHTLDYYNHAAQARCLLFHGVGYSY